MRAMKISDQVRKLIADCPVSRHRLCILTGIGAGNLANFMAGRRGISLDSLDTLGAVLGFEVVMSKATANKLAKAAPKRGRPKKTENKANGGKVTRPDAAPVKR